MSPRSPKRWSTRPGSALIPAMRLCWSATSAGGGSTRWRWACRPTASTGCSPTAPAFAHAHLVKAVPAAGGTLHDPPSEVTLRFNEKLEPAFSAVIVRDAAGKQIDKGDGKVDTSDRTLIRVTLPALEPGVYKVE